MADATDAQNRPIVTADEPTKSRQLKHYEKNKEKYHEATRRWRARNPEKVAAANAASRDARAAVWASMSDADREAIRDKRRQNYRIDEEYKEAARQRTRKWRAENLQRAREAARQRIKQDPEANRNKVRAWVKANPERARAQKSNRSALLRKAGGKHTAADLVMLMKIQNGKCAHSWCRVNIKKLYRVDHIIPVAGGGSNDKHNLQLLCPPCNHRKHAKHPIDFARENGMLL